MKDVAERREESWATQQSLNSILCNSRLEMVNSRKGRKKFVGREGEQLTTGRRPAENDFERRRRVTAHGRRRC